MKAIIRMDNGLNFNVVTDDNLTKLIRDKGYFITVNDSELGMLTLNKIHIISVQQKKEYSDNEGGLKTLIK